jgi:ABC-type uncharacterized transport system auxiliary subunit
MTHRLKPLLLATLAFSLSACAPKPQPPTTPRLQEAVEAATDLFNRGENDLACEQVKRAEGVTATSSAADVELTNQLKQYRQACEPTP